MAVEFYDPPEMIVARLVFTPAVKGYRNAAKKKVFYGEVGMTEYNADGRMLGGGCGGQIFDSPTERICKMQLLAGMQAEIDSTTRRYPGVPYEIKPLETYGLVAHATAIG
jgi:hypothetical protein